MTKRFLFRFALLMVLSSASVLAFSLRSSLREIDGNAGRSRQRPSAERQQRGDNGNHNGWFRQAARLPSGHYVTPTVINDAVQTHLNPGLPAYPDFVAGMAVRSRLSPDAGRWPSSPPARTRSIGRTARSTYRTRRSSSSCTT